MSVSVRGACDASSPLAYGFLIGFATDSTGAWTWEGQPVPDDPASGFYRLLVGCTLTRTLLLPTASPVVTGFEQELTGAQQFAAAFVAEWWDLTISIEDSLERWRESLSIRRRYPRSDEPSVAIGDVANAAVVYGTVERDLWEMAALGYAENGISGHLSRRWRDARYPESLKRSDLRNASGRLIPPWEEELQRFRDALPTIPATNALFDADVQMVLGGASPAELQRFAFESGSEIAAMQVRAAQIVFPGPDATFEESVAQLSSILI